MAYGEQERDERRDALPAAGSLFAQVHRPTFHPLPILSVQRGASFASQPEAEKVAQENRTPRNTTNGEERDSQSVGMSFPFLGWKTRKSLSERRRHK